MIQTPTSSWQIYQALQGLCSPYSLPAPWKTWPVDEDVRLAPPDPSQALAQLTERFDAQELVRAGVAQTTATGLIPAPPLLAQSPLVFLRPHPEKPPREVLSGAGCLSGMSLPVLASLSDHRTIQGLREREQELLVTSSTEDLAVLRALGFATSLATGLERIDE